MNPQNQVTGITRTLGSTTTQATTRHDAAGNLTFDGTYFYQYDAWGRLLQINRAHEETGSVGGGNCLNGGSPATLRSRPRSSWSSTSSSSTTGDHTPRGESPRSPIHA
ncbi:MAG: hypothetical protein KF745_14090 [Phycisphaeraceae bacterium]|nr:hypothetical protein [Phycisphaeraceae bacterium]